MENHEEKQFRRMTTAKTPGLILSLGLPAVVSMLVSAVYNSADTYFVSRLGTSAAAAVGVVFSLMALIQAIAFTIGQGASSLISRRLGEKNEAEASEYASGAVAAGLVISTVFAAVCLAFMTPLMRLLGATDTMLPYASDYARYILIFAPAMSLAFIFNNLLRAEGKIRFAMIGITSGGLLNLALDPLFIFTFNMGSSGAAIATGISQTVSLAILASVYLRKKTITRLSLSRVPRSATPYFETLKMGVPAFCRQGLSSLSTIMLNNQARLYGDAAVAAVAIVAKIFMLMFSVSLGIGQGYQPVCGYNYGARLYPRVREAFSFTLKLSTALMLACSAAIFIFAKNLMGLFVTDDVKVMETGAFMLRAQCLAMPLVPFTVLSNMTFQSVGRAGRSTLLSCCRQGICFIPLVLILPRALGLFGVQTAQAFADLLTFIVALPLSLSFFRSLPREDKSAGGLQ